MDIYFHSENVACQIEPDDNAVMISIIEHGIREVPLRVGWRHLLQLRFDDLDKDVWIVKCLSDKRGFDALKRYHFFDEEDAGRIIAFCNDLPGNVKRIHVHCAAGVSRSAAVAHWLAAKPGSAMKTDLGSWPNPWVMKTLYRTENLMNAPDEKNIF